MKPRPSEIEAILDELEDLSAEHDYVIVDLEGTRDKIVTYALSSSDLVLIPTNGSTMEVIQGADTVRLIESTAKMTRRKIPFSFVFTRMNAAFQTTDEKSVIAELKEHDLPYLKARVVTRSPYSQLFREAVTLAEIREAVIEATANSVASKRAQEVGRIDKAISNASQLVSEILSKLEGDRSE